MSAIFLQGETPVDKQMAKDKLTQRINIPNLAAREAHARMTSKALNMFEGFRVES